MTSVVVTDLTILRLLEPHGGNRCAVDILSLFKWFASKERPGYWFKARYVDIARYLGGLYPKSAIAKATKLLNDLGILLQHRHSRDGQIRTFYYEFRPEKLSDIGKTLEVQNETLEVQNEILEVQNEDLTIYINPPSLSPHTLDPLPDPWNEEEKEKEGDKVFSEEISCSQFQDTTSQMKYQSIPHEDKNSAANSPLPKKRIIEQKEAWEIAPGRPYPLFLNWWAETKYKPQGGYWATDAHGNAYAEFYNNRQKTNAIIFPQFLQYMQKVTENCNQSLNAGFKPLLPSHFILQPEATHENVWRLMQNVQNLIDKGVQVALPQGVATSSCSQSMSIDRAENKFILPLEELPKLKSADHVDDVFLTDLHAYWDRILGHREVR